MGNNHDFLQRIVSRNFGIDATLENVKNVSGGCISHAASLLTNKGSFFIKWGQAKSMYLAESAGLKLLEGKSDLKIPQVVDVDAANSIAYILMEMISDGAKTDLFWDNLGRGLAQLHRHSETMHGLDQDNFIGALAQENKYKTSWPDFFIENRLEVQLKLATEKQLIEIPFAQKFRKIYKRLREMLPEDKPALLHGDLWSGNILPTEDGAASLIDPAVYYGSREIEIAFTHLFGGFDQRFYRAYEESYPLESGFSERIPVYNLYPLLVHANMFGAGYLSSVEEVVNRLS